MTTGNGNGQGRIVEHVDGQVASSNDRGVKLVGEDGYRNFSKYTVEPITPPSRGAHVRLGLDASGFVRELQILDSGSVNTSSATSTERSREIRRLACLKAAATFAAGKCLGGDANAIKSSDVLAIATAWERWVLAPETED